MRQPYTRYAQQPSPNLINVPVIIPYHATWRAFDDVARGACATSVTAPRTRTPPVPHRSPFSPRSCRVSCGVPALGASIRGTNKPPENPHTPTLSSAPLLHRLALPPSPLVPCHHHLPPHHETHEFLARNRIAALGAAAATGGALGCEPLGVRQRGRLPAVDSLLRRAAEQAAAAASDAARPARWRLGLAAPSHCTHSPR